MIKLIYGDPIMFKTFIKLFLLLTFSLSDFLYADEATTYITISNASANESTGKMTFTVTIDALPLSFFSPVRIGFETIDGTAKVVNNDYIAKDSADMFTPAIWFFSNSGTTSKTIEIDILDDAIYETDEYFYVQISTNTSGYAVSGTGKAVGTIINDDAQPFKLDRFYNKSVTETDDDQPIQVTAYFNQNTPSALTLTYHTEDASASSGSDYVGITDTINVPAGVNSVPIPVTIKGDFTPEVSKNFKIIIDSISVGTVTDSEAIVTINDDDAIKVDVSCNDSNEGNNGDSNNIQCKIYLTKDFPIGEPSFTVDYTSQDGSSTSATAGDDYTTINNTVTFQEGVSEHLINIPIIGDNEVEDDENVRLVISNSSFIIGAGYSEAEIINDDGEYPGMGFGSDMSTTDFYVVEGNSSQRNLDFTFTLDAPAVAGASFDYYTEDVNTDESNDYVPISTTYNIPTGDRNVTVSIKVNGDTNIEDNEIFNLRITNEQRLRVYGHTAKGHILNDDGSYPIMSVDQDTWSIDEGDVGQKTLDFTFTLDKPAFPNSSFEYYTQHIDTNGSDYITVPTTTHVFSGGETNVTISIQINGDTKIENDERFNIYITNEQNLSTSGTRSPVGIIVNDDGNFSKVSISAPILEIDEGNTSDTNLTFFIQLDTNTTEDNVTVQYRTVNGSAEVIDNDYQEIPLQTVTFNAGEYLKEFSVTIKGDTNIEPNESFYIELLNPNGLTLSTENSIEIIIFNDDAHSEDPFVCDSSMYLSSSIKRGSGASGKMWLHKIDTTQNPFAFNVVDDAGETKLYNALAYADSGDVNTSNYIFGLYFKELLKLTKTGKVISLGNITGLPNFLSTKQLFAGAIYGDEYYVSGPGQNYDKIFKIKLSDKTVSDINLSRAISLLDFSFTPDGKYLHGIIDGGELVKIDVLTGVVTAIGSAHTGYQFDSTFSDKNGRFFANDSKGNGFFEFDLTTGNKLFLSNSQQASFNDGANCLQAALIFNDYGDAPSSYGSPKHNIANGIFMGSEIDHDINPFDSINADGDDSNGVDDEDGITFVDGSDINGSYFDVNGTQELNITVSKDGYLNAWLDFGIDGNFVGDKIITAQALTAGTHTISFNIPSTVTKNQLTYIRFRYSSTANLDFEESAIDGEVEDYAIKFGSASQPLRGKFNIERTNSGSETINSVERNAWYTQIVGRDFDYSIVFYEEDMSAEKEIDNISIKVELVDMDTNTTLYQRSAHILDNPLLKRIDVTIPAEDLQALPATKNARFAISYGVDTNGNIIQADCLSTPSLCPLIRRDYALDNFSIRPEKFYVSIADGAQERVNSNTPTPINFAAGYDDYNLSVKATKYIINYPAFVAAEGYDATVNRNLKFNTVGTCRNNSDQNKSITLNNGIYRDSNFSNPYVGEYQFNIIEDSTWTTVDQNGRDCISNDASTSSDFNSPSGCNISQISDINVYFQPDHFEVNLLLETLPDSGHPDFIYMSELNNNYHNVAVQFTGEVLAKNENNRTTENFTTGCVAKDIQLDLNATSLSIEGTNQQIQTILGTNVNFSRYINYNSSSSNPTSELNQALNTLNGSITITPDKFLDEKNGTVELDMRYNLNKHLSEPINPIEITFNSIEVSSNDANSKAYDKINIISNIHTPSGFTNFSNNVKNFYFAKVVSKFNEYPAVNISNDPLIRTPLHVVFFCKTNIQNYCEDRNVLTNSNALGTTKDQDGWHLSSNHNGQLDGNVTGLIDNPDQLSIRENGNLIVGVNNNIMLDQGSNDMVMPQFNNCVNPSSIITINTNPVLEFHPSEYTLKCINAKGSWTGVGKTGHLLEITPQTTSSSKMNW